MSERDLVRRCLVKKRSGFDIEAAGLLHDLQQTLGLQAITGLRIYNRYDVSGLTDGQFEQAKNGVFAEPPVDDVYDEVADFGSPAAVFAVEALPGQYDQRADSAAQCIQVLTCEERPLCKTARVYVLEGSLTPADLVKVKAWLINPVEAREADLAKPDSLEEKLEPPAPVGIITGFRGFSDEKINQFIASAGLAMSPADLRLTRDYFQNEGRDPTWTELRVLDTYWSDHCRHTTFLTRIDNVEFPDRDPLSARLRADYEHYLQKRREVFGADAEKRSVCLMDLATLAMRLLRSRGKLDDLDVSPEINACSIRADIDVDGRPQTWLIQFKNETHNHPTEIEPFGGAATCLGGAIRDPLSGRAYVYQAMRITGSGDPTVPVGETLPGKLPQRKITTTAAAGYSSYGNQVGLATGLVEEFYHLGYTAKRLEIGAVIGAVPADQVRREEPLPGDQVILLGGRTGRDGCGGATGSSKAHDDQSLVTCGSEVQKGNPPTERKIQRLFRDPEVSRLIRRCNDFGAGGVSVAIGELAAGLHIDLDRVPRKYEGLDGTELAISESQERMAVVVAAADVAKFTAAAARENLEAVTVAEVTAQRRMVMTWRGQTIVDLDRAFIDTNGAEQAADIVCSSADAADWFWQTAADQAQGGFAPALKRNLASLQSCSRQGLVERFDSTIGAATVLMPFGGKKQLTPEEGMAALIPVPHGQTTTCSLMSYGFDPDLASRSPYHGAYFAVLASLSRIAALGGDPFSARLTFQEYFRRLQSAQDWGQPLAALLGAYRAQLDFGVPSIGGKDSMSGTFNDLHVPPTLVSFAVALTRADKVLSSCLVKPDQPLFLLPVPCDDLALPVKDEWLPRLRLARDLIAAGKITAAATVRQSGPAVAAARMCLGNDLGFVFSREAEGELFFPHIGALLLAADPADSITSDSLLAGGALLIGRTQSERRFELAEDPDGDKDTKARDEAAVLSLDRALLAWRRTLDDIFPAGRDSDIGNLAEDIAGESEKIPPADDFSGRKVNMLPAGGPRVFIPVFPGTNCEYDTMRAFERQGARATDLVVRNLTPQAIGETIEQMAREIDRAQILVLPGGFSAGDEPEGSGKFIAAFLSNPYLAEAIHNLLDRQGLILGICNGFQALIKLGLLPGGRITPLRKDSPTLTFNNIGRHVSCYVATRVVTKRSPWLHLAEPGAVTMVPVSHGEGRFVASAQQIKQLADRGQIATQYVDLDGLPTGRGEFNPNGSLAAIEGITSPDGRILGKMAHSERSGRFLARNIPGSKDDRIIASGVAWFK